MTFEVKNENSQHHFSVAPGESILEAALHQGIGLPYGCRNGACGSCVATLLSGTVYYPNGEPEALAGQGTNNQIAVCQAHPQSDLLINVREVEAARDISIKKIPCRADHLERLSHDVFYRVCA